MKEKKKKNPKKTVKTNTLDIANLIKIRVSIMDMYDEIWKKKIKEGK